MIRRDFLGVLAGLFWPWSRSRSQSQNKNRDEARHPVLGRLLRHYTTYSPSTDERRGSEQYEDMYCLPGSTLQYVRFPSETILTLEFENTHLYFSQLELTREVAGHVGSMAKEQMVKNLASLTKSGECMFDIASTSTTKVQVRFLLYKMCSAGREVGVVGRFREEIGLLMGG